MLRRKPLRVLVLLSALAVVGCAHPIVASAPVLYPALVPVRAFPSILVAGDRLPEGDLPELLRAHLAQDGKHEVRRVEVSALEPWRKSGAILPHTLVVLIQAAIHSDVNGQWQNVPTQFCDYYWGCYTSYQPVYATAYQVLGQASLTVYEGPTARALQTEHFQAVVDAPDSPEARQRVFQQLAVQVTRAVDVIKSEARIELEPVSQPTAKRAIELVRQGSWDEGRSLLEQAVQEIGGAKRRVQARVWYDLGIARWFAPGPEGLTQAAYDSAQQALLRAIELDRTHRYRIALERLRLARERERVLEEQRRAAAHNFALTNGTPAAR